MYHSLDQQQPLLSDVVDYVWDVDCILTLHLLQTNV